MYCVYYYCCCVYHCVCASLAHALGHCVCLCLLGLSAWGCSYGTLSLSGEGSTYLRCFHRLKDPGGSLREKIFFSKTKRFALSKTPTKSILDFGRRYLSFPRNHDDVPPYFREKIKMGPIRNPFHIHLTRALQDRL